MARQRGKKRLFIRWSLTAKLSAILAPKSVETSNLTTENGDVIVTQRLDELTV